MPHRWEISVIYESLSRRRQVNMHFGSLPAISSPIREKVTEISHMLAFHLAGPTITANTRRRDETTITANECYFFISHSECSPPKKKSMIMHEKVKSDFVLVNRRQYILNYSTAIVNDIYKVQTFSRWQL